MTTDRCTDTYPHPRHGPVFKPCPGVPAPRPVPTTSDRIPLRDIPIAERLQQRLREAEERNTELHAAVTRAETERDQARVDRDRYARTAVNLLHQRNEAANQAEQANAEADRIRVQREQLATVLAEILRSLSQPPGGGDWSWVRTATVQRWRDVLGQHGEAVDEDAIRAAKAGRCPSRIVLAVGPALGCLRPAGHEVGSHIAGGIVWTDDDERIAGYGPTTPPTGDPTDATA